MHESSTFLQQVAFHAYKLRFSVRTPKAARVDTWTTLEICHLPEPTHAGTKYPVRGNPSLRITTKYMCLSVDFFNVFYVFLDFGPEMGSRRAGRGLKRSLEAVGFILAEFEPKPSHGDPIRDQTCGFGTFDMC